MYKRTPTPKPFFKRRRTWVIAGIITLAVACVAGVLAYKSAHDADVVATGPDTSATRKIDYSPAKPSDNTANEDRKNTTSKTGSTGTTLNTPEKTPSFTVTVSRANKAAGGIQTAATVSGETQPGTCTFTATPHGGGQAVTVSEPSQLSNSSYICAGITIPVGSGTWDVAVSVTSNGETATNNWAANPVST